MLGSPSVSLEEQLVRVLIYLLNYRFAVLELLRTGALSALFSMLVSECPPHNHHLRDRYCAHP